MRAVTVSLLSLGVSLTAACNGAQEDPPFAYEHAPDGAPLQDAGVSTVVGTVHLREDRSVYDGDGTPVEQRAGQVDASYFAQPPPRWHREVARAGECVLLRYTPALCDPACEGGAVCVDTNTCAPPADFAYAGAIRFAGLRAAVELIGQDGYYYASDALPADLFDDDATVSVTLAGAEIAAHTISARGVAPLVPDLVSSITLEPGQDHVVRWTPAAGDARIRLTLNGNNAGHGAPYAGIIECDSPDVAGAVTIAAALVDGFPPTQAWTVCAGHDCPPSTIERYRRGVAAIGASQAELIVSSRYSFGVVHTPE